MVVIRLLDNTLKIKHATLTVEDEKGHIMNIEIDAEELKITNCIEESDDPWPMWGSGIPPRHLATSFLLETSSEYVVTYDQKEQV
jgi:hypothetical protein